MRKIGRPSKYRKDFHPEDFIRQSKEGKTFAQIAAAWDIDRDTLWSWGKKHKDFSDSIKKGRELAEAWYMKIGQGAMLNRVEIHGKQVKVELGWFVWLTKNMFKWNDRTTHEHSGPEGNPIQTENKTSDLTDADLNNRIKKLWTKANIDAK